MPIAIHPSSPATVISGFEPVTAAFSPPANSVLVAVVNATGAATMSNTVTARTWSSTKVHPDFAGVAIYTAPNPTAVTNMTVKLGGTGGALKVYVLTGVKASSFVGASATGRSTVNNVTPTVFTSTAGGSFPLCNANEVNTLGLPTSTDDEIAWYSAGNLVAGMGIVKASSAPSGTGITFDLDAFGTGTPDWYWVAVEFLADALDATVSATIVEGAGDVPAPTLHAGATATPPVVEGAGDVPAPGLHAGATASPATVEGAGNVPAPNVIAGSAELVEPAVVTGVGDVPSPTITAVSNATTTPAAVEGVGDVPAPTVTATFQATISPDVVEGEGQVPSPGVSVPILPGTLITTDGQVEWGGTALWGEGTSYALLEITGWDAKPQVDSLTEEEPGRHGAFGGKSLLQRRIVTVKLQVQSFADPSQVSGLLAQLRYDTRTLRDNTFWTLVVRGYTETLLAYGKCIDRTGVMDRDWSIGAPEPVITFECPDPRRYSLDQHSVVVPANASLPTGMVNDGDLYTPPTLRFTGPATNPMIVNETLDRVLAFNITLTSGQILVVDTQLGTATIAGVDHENDLADTISVPLKEFFAEVGSNDLSYETDSGGTAGVEVLWRDASE